MSRGILKGIATVAGVVAVVATAGAALVPGLAIAGVGTAAAIAGVAGAISAAANLGAQLLTKPPPARGSVSQVVIAVEPLQPYGMGKGLLGGVRRYDKGYGATLKDVPNPYLWLVDVMSGGGPVASIEPRLDKKPISSWLTGFLWTSVALGACPAAALTPHFAGPPGWTASSKLSGQAAVGFNALFDKDGKRFASGVGETGAEGDWVLAYDPRKDDTFPGGVGPHRLGDETTYEWTENPALHAGTYAFGRYQNGKRTIGCGFPAETIDWGNIAAWANVCDANEWIIFGRVFEPGNRWPNLQEIAAAGGARPVVAGGKLGFVYHAPRVAQAIVSYGDLAADPVEVTAQGAYGDRITSIIPKWTSPEHEWQQIAGAALTIGDFIAEEGEDRVREWPFNLVKSSDGRQPAELALYQLWNAHELQPIVLPLKHHMRHVRAGWCIELALEEYGLTMDAVVVQRQFDPTTLQPVLICVGETPEKHAFILGETSTPPPTPALGQTRQERDELAAAARDPTGLATLAISSSYTRGLAGNITQADNGDGTATITIPDHTRVYADGSEVPIDGGELALANGLTRLIFYDDAARAGGAVSYQMTASAADGYFSADHPYRHFVGYVTAVDAGGGGGSVGGSSPPGGGGWNGDTPPTHEP